MSADSAAHADARASAVPCMFPRRDRDYAITTGLRIMLLRHMVAERDGLFSANPAETALLRCYANSIAHLLAE